MSPQQGSISTSKVLGKYYPAPPMKKALEPQKAGSSKRNLTSSVPTLSSQKATPLPLVLVSPGGGGEDPLPSLRRCEQGQELVWDFPS